MNVIIFTNFLSIHDKENVDSLYVVYVNVLIIYFIVLFFAKCGVK